MHFLNPRCALVHSPIYRCSDRQSTSYDRADTGEKTCKGLRSLFSVDNFHWRYVVAEEDAWDTAPGKNLVKML